MRFEVLGCSGGIGDGRHTTSFLIDDDILLDAGSGVTRLSRAALARIDHLFLTHSHLDHILSLPTLLDSVAGERDQPLQVHALPEVLDILKAHIFNWKIWPDFAVIPSPEAPFMRYAPLAVGESVVLGGRTLTAIPAHHVVPAVGFLVHGDGGSLIFSGDTASHDALWRIAEDTADLRHILVECSFPKALSKLAQASKHYATDSLAADLGRLRSDAAVWISHLKPGGEAGIMAELDILAPGRAQALQDGMVFDL